MRWDPNKKPPGGNLFLLIGGWTHCFTILFSYWFSTSTIKNPIVPNQKKNGSATAILFLVFGGVLVMGRRDYIARNWQHTSGTILQMWETTIGSHWIHLRKTGVSSESSIFVMVWNLILRKALKNAALRNVTFQQVGGWLGMMNQGDPRNTSTSYVYDSLLAAGVCWEALPCHRLILQQDWLQLGLSENKVPRDSLIHFPDKNCHNLGVNHGKLPMFTSFCQIPLTFAKLRGQRHPRSTL